jgi:hypothetical protein
MEQLEIIGLTATERTTVALLQMKCPGASGVAALDGRVTSFDFAARGSIRSQALVLP